MKFDYNKKHKVGDIIYPYYNGTAVWYKRSIWSVVTEVDDKGHWKTLKYWYSDETARLYSIIIKLSQKRGRS